MRFSIKDDLSLHPVDVIEHMAKDFGWGYERVSEDEINMHIMGEWCRYNFTVHWNPQIEGLHFGVAFEFKIPPRRVAELEKLILLINEQLWLGHFEFWGNSDILMVRYGTILAGGQGFSDLQCHTIINHTVETCEQYYAAFQFTLWADKEAESALMACLLDITGNA